MTSESPADGAPADGASQAAAQQDGLSSEAWQGREWDWAEWQWSSQPGRSFQSAWRGSSWANAWSYASPWWTGSWERSGSSGWSRDSQGDQRSGWAGAASQSQHRQQHGHDMQGESGQRRSSATSTEVSTDTADHDHEGLDEQDTRDSDLGSSSTKKDLPKTGKDYVPEYSGETPMREYQTRVRLFESSTGIDASYRAQKLMERLSGQAWLATESLDLDYIKHPDGVKRLLQHLWQELEPLEYLRTFTTLSEFYKGFKRSPGMEYITYDMEFRAHLKHLEEVGAKIEGLTQAFWFIEKAGLSGELRKQVFAAAGGEYDYVKLRRALLAIVPKVDKGEDSGGANRFSPGNRQWKPRNNHTAPRQVHATLDELVDDPEGHPVEEAEAEGDSAALEGELEVLLTQAARKRAQIEKARGFTKQESSTEREQRIKEMKARMPCSACKAHGKTVYGHWHGDAACPYRRERDKEKNVLAVVTEQLSDSDSDQEELLGPSTHDIFIATSTDADDIEGDIKALDEVWVGVLSRDMPAAIRFTLALSDTCCARTVAGEKWVTWIICIASVRIPMWLRSLDQIGLEQDPGLCRRMR